VLATTVTVHLDPDTVADRRRLGLPKRAPTEP
jgi:hypothetical protein